MRPIATKTATPPIALPTATPTCDFFFREVGALELVEALAGEVFVVEIAELVELLVYGELEDVSVVRGICVETSSAVNLPGAVVPVIPGITLGRSIGVVKPVKVYSTCI